MIYTSFVSKNTVYEEVVQKFLIPSLEKWNLNYDIDYIEDRGSWAKNVYYKPEFIYKMLLKHKQPIVSLDADATIEKYPELFDKLPNDIDLAVHYLDWQSWYGKGNKKELLGGTLYFNYNEKVLNMVTDWMVTQKKVEQYAQRVLAKTLEVHKHIKIYELPLSYCYIKTLPQGGEPLVKLDPVILHHQVSRVFKHKKL